MSGAIPRFPWKEGDALFASALNDALTAVSSGGPFLPLAGGTVGPLTVQNSLGIGGSAAPNASLLMQSSPGTDRVTSYYSGGGIRWQVGARGEAETGANLGSPYQLGAFSDSGAFKGFLLLGQRGSGPVGEGNPYFSYMSAFQMSAPKAPAPGGTSFIDIDGTQADVQPITTLGNNPLSVTSGSPTVTVTWPGSGAAGGAIFGGFQVWVLLSGAAAVGGITPSGWLHATVVDADHFSVTWTANATSTAVGGGSSVTVRPSFATSGSKYFHIARSGAGDFPVQYNRLYVAAPEFLRSPAQGFGPQFQQEWRMAFGPKDTAPAGTHGWGMTGTELDLVNRGTDPGYAPNLYGAPNPTIGFWVGAYNDVPSFVPDGGVATNWNTIFAVFSQGGAVGNYVSYSSQQNALVGAARDPTGHGGVGVVLYGALNGIPPNAFATVSGSNVVTVTPYGLTAQVNGDSVYIPTVQTINGVTFGGAAYVMSAIAATTFQITGTGSASATGVGGAVQNIYYQNLVPYAPMEFRGSYKHGISTTEFRSEDGSIIRTQPGNGVVWDDGAGVVSSITGSASGRVVVAGQLATATALVNAANDAAAASAGVAIDSFYRNGSVVMQRVV